MGVRTARSTTNARTTDFDSFAALLTRRTEPTAVCSHEHLPLAEDPLSPSVLCLEARRCRQSSDCPLTQRALPDKQKGTRSGSLHGSGAFEQHSACESCDLARGG